MSCPKQSKKLLFFVYKKKMSCIWRFLYHDVIVPGDTFPMMMRKMIMALSVIAGNIGLLNLITTAQPTNETHAI